MVAATYTFKPVDVDMNVYMLFESGFRLCGAWMHILCHELTFKHVLPSMGQKNISHRIVITLLLAR